MGNKIGDFSNTHPNSGDILEDLFIDEETKRGRLEIFFGYAAGIGKTYAMLDDAQEMMRRGIDVVVGYIGEHSQAETIHLMNGLPSLTPQIVGNHKDQLKEFDLDAALARKPSLILVDELAHTNAQGMRNKKRYQDIEELLNAGIDVFTTMNVQHLESLFDVIQKITKSSVKETIPDYIFNHADKIRLIDLEPDELLRRFESAKMDHQEKTQKVQDSFFTRENLRLLREIAMRKAAARISSDNQNEPRLSKKMANIRLMVCVGSSPSSARCIRWTEQTAEAFRAPWTAVYVETMDSDSMSDHERKMVHDNLALAERLGAEIITLNGYDVPSVLAEYAKLSGITNIVIGKSRNKKSVIQYFKASLEEKLILLLPNIEIHIIPGNLANHHNNLNQHRRWKISQNLFFSWQDGIKTLLIIAAATFFSFWLQALNITDQNIILVYILSVLIISRVTMGYFYGILASCLTVLVYTFFFKAPYYNFHVIQKGYPITFLFMLMVSLITGALTVRIKTQARMAVEREHRTELLYEINKKLLASRDLEETINLINDYMVRIFRRSVVFYRKNPKEDGAETILLSSQDENSASLLNTEEREVAYWAFINKKNAGSGTDTLSRAKVFYMPIIAQGKVLGVIGLSCANGVLSQNNRMFMRMLTPQVEMALERHYLSNEQRKSVVESEKEKMRSNLLRGISHDLRTPLTGISGASSAIIENGHDMDQETRDTLLENIKEESQWLIRIVENLLTVTRINEGPMTVRKSPEAAEEIVAEAISRIRKRFDRRKIKVKVPDELLIVPMDGILIEQVLINLLENGIKNSPEDSVIEIEVKEFDGAGIFEVSDQGKGISDEDLPYLFDPYVPDGKRSSDSSRGMGIGLSICYTIVNAHQGKMTVENKEQGGAIFRFTLPLQEVKNG